MPRYRAGLRGSLFVRLGGRLPIDIPGVRGISTPAHAAEDDDVSQESDHTRVSTDVPFAAGFARAVRSR